MSGAYLFQGKPSDPTDLRDVVGQAMGAASSCWESLAGTGVFQADRAADILDEVVWWIEGHYELKREFRDGGSR